MKESVENDGVESEVGEFVGDLLDEFLEVFVLDRRFSPFEREPGIFDDLGVLL